jgi:hypothetical protein
MAVEDIARAPPKANRACQDNSIGLRPKPYEVASWDGQQHRQQNLTCTKAKYNFLHSFQLISD